MADISKIKLPNDNNTYNLADLVARGRIWQGTQAQYDALVQAGTIDPDTIYFVTDGTTVACASNEVTYDHTVSGLSASDVKGALDELASEKADSSSLNSKMDKTNPTGTGSLSLNKASGSTLGTNAVAVGTNCIASGNMSCAIGDTNTASGAQSFAAGAANTASGERSAVIGSNASASGSRSIAMGQGTIAQRKAQHVFGEYNIADTTGEDGTVRGSYVEIVGKGTGNNSRSNARTLDWSGNEVLAGGLKINGNKDVLAITSDFTTIARNASATITMTKQSGILIITRARSAQVVTISYYALYLHNNAYVNFELMTNAADNTVTLTTLGSKQLQISTTAEYGIAFRLIEF